MSIPFKVVIVEDHPLIAESLTSLIDSIPETEILACASNGHEALSLILATKPDILLTDLNIPGLNGLDLIARVKQQYPALKIIVLTMYDTLAIVKKVIEMGVDAYLLKEEGKQEIVQAIEEVLAAPGYFI
jgi:YesN/AraC family two-component response regulator